MFRAFCADPNIPSRLKLWRCDLSAVGDLRADLGVPLPLVAARVEAGMSTEKLSLLGGRKGLTAAAVVVAVTVTEWGESPVDEGDIFLLLFFLGDGIADEMTSRSRKNRPEIVLLPSFLDSPAARKLLMSTALGSYCSSQEIEVGAWSR